MGESEGSRRRLRPRDLPGSPSGATILVADDEPGVRDLLAEILTSLGYRLLIATDGVHAIELTADHEGPIDLLLTDISMPRMDGVELAKQLAESGRVTRILLLSGTFDHDILGELNGYGTEADFLAKPFDIAALSRRLQQLLDLPAAGYSGSPA